MCLHPDLFSPATDAPSFTNSAQLSTAMNSKMQLASATSSDEKNTNAAASSGSQSKILQVGDMIEIRVWDPLPRTNSAPASNVSSIIRQRTVQANSAASVSLPTSAASSTSSAVQASDANGSDATDTVASTLDRGRTPSNTNNMVQNSDTSVADVTGTGEAIKEIASEPAIN